MKVPTVALLYPGDRSMRDRADPTESRFATLFEAFARAGVEAVPAVYNDAFAEDVERQLRKCAMVLVWCNPIEGGRRRVQLDALLRRVVDCGVVVSAHPDTIMKLGTKDVLFETRDLPFGSDVHRVDGLKQLEEELPGRLQLGPRVLKEHRGHSGIGIWRVELLDAGSTPWRLRVRHAQRGSVEESMDFSTLLATMKPYFEPTNGGHMIDQAWQPRLVEGMVRAYLVKDRVAGFGYQPVNALYPGSPGEPAPQPGPRGYHDADPPQFQELRGFLETAWVEMLRVRLGMSHEQLPFLWDCDFMFGEPLVGTRERFVLCEINVSSVAPFPDSAIEPLVLAVRRRLGI